MMFRLTNLSRANRIIHDAKMVPQTLAPDVTRHVDLNQQTAISMKQFNKKTIRIEPVDEEAATALNVKYVPRTNKMTREADHPPEKQDEAMELALGEHPPEIPVEEQAKVAWGSIDGSSELPELPHDEPEAPVEQAVKPKRRARLRDKG